MKKYLVKRSDDSSKNAVVGAKGFVPDNSYELPLDLYDEDGEWLQVEMINDEFGTPRATVTINQPEKDRILQDRLDQEMANEEDAAARQAEIDDIKGKALGFNKAQVGALADIRDELKNIYSILEHLTKEL